MRENITQQCALVASAIDHWHAAELEKMGALLRGLKGAAKRVADDLRQGVVHVDKGRRGLSGDQVLRMLVLKQMTGFSYEQLAFHLADSSSYQRFCMLGIDGWAPKASTLQANIKRVQPATLGWVNRQLLRKADKLGVDDGATVIVDSTAVEADIHQPTDNSLLFDGVRVLSRLLRRSREFIGVSFSNHTRRAKRRSLAISNGKNMKRRAPLYQDLLKITAQTLGYVRPAVEALGKLDSERAGKLRDELKHYASLVSRVADQTQRRVFGGESVPAAEKVVSLFEPHTEQGREDRWIQPGCDQDI